VLERQGAAGSSGESEQSANDPRGADWLKRLQTAEPSEVTTADKPGLKLSQSADSKARVAEQVTQEPPTVSALALPTGGDKSGITSHAISVPKGSGTVDGMGESFSTQLSTGVATFSVPFQLPAGRGVSASLSLSYSSGSGAGLAGMGWDVSVPFIARQTDRGIPKYLDQASWHAEQDRFVFNGGQELVPICTVDVSLQCLGALTNVSLPSGMVNETMPAWSGGWQYFRARVEGSYLRFFWSPGHKTWRVQDKSGESMEFGVPLDGSNDTSALESNPDQSVQVYRWNLVRQYDAHGSVNTAGNPTPTNVVVYRYAQDAGSGATHLTDIYDTTRVQNPTDYALSAFAHHTHLKYEQRTDPTVSYRSGWRIEERLRLKRVDVTSATDGATGNRRQVRRYHLSYEAGQHISLLSSVQIEGRCASNEDTPNQEGNDALLPEATTCGRLPAMKFGYQHVTPYNSTGSSGVTDLPGYEGFDERVLSLPGSPPHSLDEELTGLLDINGDALPDVLVTAPGVYGNGHGVFYKV
jgi:hypothetical protein